MATEPDIESDAADASAAGDVRVIEKDWEKHKREVLARVNAISDESHREDLIKQATRDAAAADLANLRWRLARDVHLLEDGESKLNFHTHPFQEELYQDACLDRVIYGAAQWGKALRYGQLVITPTGWRRIEDIRPGDLVCNIDGSVSCVTGWFPQGRIPIFRVATAGARTSFCCAEHLWQCWTESGPRVMSTAGIASHRGQGGRVELPVAGHATPFDGYRITSYDEITAIEPAGIDDAACIAIDHPSRLFITNDYLVSHNTEWLMCEMFAAAMYGLKVLSVTSKYEKRNKFVSTRLDPCIGTVPMYREAVEAARARSATTDNVGVKGFGPGSFNMVAATSTKDFTSYPADMCLIDEHQECNQENLVLLDDRMSGSAYRFMTRIGHPTTEGTEENGNLDWLYKNSDRRIWKVPCPTCREFQKLTWFEHIVHVQINKSGGIVAVRPRDEEYRPGQKLDIRPVCMHCSRPMNRLSRKGIWQQEQPGHARHGWKLSNLYNANKRMIELYDRYSAARHKPNRMAEFVNKQLGEPWTMDGTKITEAMLQMCGTGTVSGIAPYRFFPANQIAWRKDVRA